MNVLRIRAPGYGRWLEIKGCFTGRRGGRRVRVINRVEFNKTHDQIEQHSEVLFSLFFETEKDNVYLDLNLDSDPYSCMKSVCRR